MPTLETRPVSNTAGGPINTYDDRIDHENNHWYGKPGAGDGHGWTKPPFDPLTNPTTGLLAQLVRRRRRGSSARRTPRAIEVSLGIPHDADMQDHDWIDHT